MMTMVAIPREHCALIAPVWPIFIKLVITLVFILGFTLVVFTLIFILVVYTMIFTLVIIRWTVFVRALVILATLRWSMGLLC